MKLSSHTTIKDLTQGAIYVREFAYRVFLSAEKQDSSPSNIKKVLQSYLAAVNFLQVYRGVFLEDPSVLDLSDEEAADELKQVDEKSKFAKWRILEIKKQLMTDNITRNTANTANTSPNTTNYQSPPIQTSKLSEPSHSIPQQPQSPQQIYTAQATSQISSPPALLYDPKVLSECEKQARHAISALNFDDVETAAVNLRAALNTLQPYLKENKK